MNRFFGNLNMQYASDFGGDGAVAERAKGVPLDTLPVGSRCRVVAMDETSDNLLRLMEMGLIPGATVVIERTAPFRSPYSLRLSGCTLAIRRDDAHRVLVVPAANGHVNPELVKNP
jgi:Fe2+ transport system protein FeoA